MLIKRAVAALLGLCMLGIAGISASAEDGDIISVITTDGVEVEFDCEAVKPGERVEFEIALEEDHIMRGLEIFVRGGDITPTPVEFDIIGVYHYSFVLPEEGVDIFVRSEDYGKVSRADLVTELWELAGCPIVNYLMTYGDISGDEPYAEAVRWATSESLIKGDTEGNFGPDLPLSREALAVILHRYAGELIVDASVNDSDSLCEVTDADFISSWAYDSVAWCIETGILRAEWGNCGYFRPQKALNRYELSRAINTIDELLNKSDEDKAAVNDGFGFSTIEIG